MSSVTYYYVERLDSHLYRVFERESCSFKSPVFVAEWHNETQAKVYTDARNRGDSHDSAIRFAMIALNKKRDLEKRAAKARNFNPGPAMPLASDSAAVVREKAGAAEPVDVETGNRYKVTAVVSNLSNPIWAPVRHDLAEALNGAFGGFTVSTCTGGWRHEDGRTVVESGQRYEVSFERAADIELARQLFAIAGRRIGEKWVHVEVSTYDARHTRCESVSI